MMLKAGKKSKSRSARVDVPTSVEPKEVVEKEPCDNPPINYCRTPICYDPIPPPKKTVLNFEYCDTGKSVKKVSPTGVKQVQVTDTDAPKKIQYGTGGPPQWTSVNERLWNKVLRRQEIAKRKLAKYLAIRKKITRDQFVQDHRDLLCMAGPKWFQELSPGQLKTVDDLKNCILEDKKHNTIENVQDNICSLGLVKRPRAKYFKTALKSCCDCPVEFLLIMYQLIDKGRKEYSVNDRLLLSGVVHLTIKETLKELHIRIPSPPRPEKPKPPKKSVVIPKRKKCDSPYLEEYDFVPCPPKHSGIYKKSKIQYPENPYFSYIPELRNEMQFDSPDGRERYVKRIQLGIPSEQHEEILNELKLAEKRYNELRSSEEYVYLLKPSIYIPCDHGLLNHKKESVGGGTIEVSEKSVEDSNSSNDTCECCMCVPEIPDPCGPICVATQKSSEEIFSPTCGVTQSSNAECSEVDPCIQTCAIESYPNEDPCTCACTCTSPINSNVVPCMHESEFEISEQKICLHGEPETCLPLLPPLSSSSLSICCTCREKIEEILQSNIDQHEGWRKCDCLEKYLKRIECYEKNLKAQRQSLKSTTKKEIKEQEPFECACAKTYQERLKEQQRLANMPKIPQGKQKYVVSGVHPTNEGNVYVLSEAVDMEQCVCRKIYDLYEKRHTMCLEVYNKYMKKLEADVREYNEEIENDTRFDPASTRCLKGSDGSNPIRTSVSQKSEYNKLPTIPESGEETEQSNSSSTSKDKVKIEETVCTCGAADLDEDSGDIPCKPQPCDCAECGEQNVDDEWPCGADICSCNDDSHDGDGGADGGDDDEEGSSKESEDPQFHRFLILKKFPTKCLEQKELLKKALGIMAEDGFPLAKLPYCWKLPIFRLWITMRCGKYWTPIQQLRLHYKSKGYWKHTDVCKGKVKQSILFDMSAAEAKKYTWKHAEKIRKMVYDKEVNYNREAKQVSITEHREFFATKYSYELTNPTFRDVFFAYLPSKEDSCHIWKPWYSHEYRKVFGCIF